MAVGGVHATAQRRPPPPMLLMLTVAWRRPFTSLVGVEQPEQTVTKATAAAASGRNRGDLICQV